MQDVSRTRDERLVAEADRHRARREARRQRGGGSLTRALRRLRNVLSTEDRPPSVG